MLVHNSNGQRRVPSDAERRAGVASPRARVARSRPPRTPAPPRAPGAHGAPLSPALDAAHLRRVLLPPPPRGDQENDAPAPAVRKDRASPPARSTPAASARAVSGSTGDRLAALKALRVASRPNSGRRAGSPGSAPGDRDACAAVLPERTPRSPRGDATLRPTSRPTRGDADSEPERVPAAAARRPRRRGVERVARVRARRTRGRPARRVRRVRRVPRFRRAVRRAILRPSFPRVARALGRRPRSERSGRRLREDPKADVTFEPARIVCLLADAHLDPAESAVRVVVPNPKDDARSRAGEEDPSPLPPPPRFPSRSRSRALERPSAESTA